MRERFGTAVGRRRPRFGLGFASVGLGFAKIAGLISLATTTAGCVAGVGLEELPTEAIAITYWEPEPARRRAEIIKLRETGSKRDRQTRTGVAHVGSIGRLLGGASDAVWETDLKRFPGRLTLLNARTGKLTPVPEIPFGAVPLAWDEAHERLLYMSNHRSPIQLYEYDTTRKEIRKVTHGKHEHLWGDFGAERQMTVLQVGVERDEVFAKIFVTDETGGSERVVVDEGMIESMQLSPDGETLVYVRYPTKDRPELVAVDLSTGEERPLGPGKEPTFSRTGDWIVYSARSGDSWRLRRIRSDGSGRSTAGGAGIRDEKTPSVSPDGHFVVYVGPSMGVDRLFVRRMDGTGDRILLDAGSAFNPVW